MWLIMGLWFCAWGENDPHPVIAQSCQINVSRLASAGTETNDPFEKNPEASQVLPFQRNLALLPSEFIQPHILPLHFFILTSLHGLGKGPFSKHGVGQNTAVPASHAARYPFISAFPLHPTPFHPPPLPTLFKQNRSDVCDEQNITLYM